MKVTVEIPDHLATHLQMRWPDIPRHVLEYLVLEAYRDDIVTTREVQDLLGLENRFDVYELCKQYHIATYTLEDLQRDRDTTQRLGF
jgi:Uncharacterised protein family (UPF0175)